MENFQETADWSVIKNADDNPAPRKPIDQQLMKINGCLQMWPKSGDSRTINPATSSPIHQRNPYRTILRREYPEPLIALLVFILGIWLWDHYFGKSAGYAPGTEQVSLIKIDRDLRLAEAMDGDSALLRWLTGVKKPEAVRSDGLAVLRKLAADNSMSLSGLEAYAIIKAADENLPIREGLAETTQGQLNPDFMETSASLADHRGTWWQARWVQAMEKELPPACQWRDVYQKDALQLRNRAILAHSWVWLLGLAGLVFIPRTLKDFKLGLHAKPSGYGAAWPLTLGITMFLLATLAWIGFNTALDLGISSLPGVHPLVGILLDSVARLLPTLIALGLLFRRPSHVVRVLGMNRPLFPGNFLGVFSLLMLADILLRTAIGRGPVEPGGGLNASESGIWGLVFAMVSACLLAPLAEEALYRGVLFRSFWNRLGVLPAGLISSAIFAVLHFYDGYGLLSVGLFGLSCALLYASTGSLISCVALHLLYNSSIKLPEWLIYHALLG
jgi:membrane protease YdiL (CAAX protease family)